MASSKCHFFNGFSQSALQCNVAPTDYLGKYNPLAFKNIDVLNPI